MSYITEFIKIVVDRLKTADSRTFERFLTHITGGLSIIGVIIGAIWGGKALGLIGALAWGVIGGLLGVFAMVLILGVYLLVIGILEINKNPSVLIPKVIRDIHNEIMNKRE